MNVTYSSHKISKTVSYAIFWCSLAVVHALVMQPLIPISLEWLLLDGFLFSTLLIFLGLVYKIYVQSKLLSLTIFPQTIFNYVSLGICTMTLWLGSGLLLLYLFVPKNVFDSLLPTIPVRGLIGALIYTSAAIYDYLTPDKEIEDDENSVKEEISKKVTTSKEHIATEESSPMSEALPIDVHTEDDILERIAIRSGQKIQVVMTGEIYYFQSDGDYVLIFTEKGKYMKEQTMKYFEEHLPKNKFVRIHRSCIVNVEMISRIESYNKQQQMLILKNGHQIKASVAGYRTLKAALQL
ncbi:MAG: response regulator receiver protein [Bacteroidetes bacterium]|nr:response regulator receiver protein [Bacteroidota bacterium]